MSQSTVTEKRTVITSSSGGSGYDSLEDIPYKANFGSRSSNIMSRSSLPLRSSTGGTQVTRVVEYGYGSHLGGGMGPGGYSNVSNTGVTSVKSSREKEKKDLQDLNERFASYIEKVRFLEAQNRKLGSELDELRSKWGKETSQIKQMYEAELAEARRLIDDLSKDKAALEIKTSSMQEQFGDMQRQLDEAKKYRQTDRETINKLNQQLADCESEINMLRRSIESLETERSRDKATINRQQQEIDKLRIDLNNETLAHLDAENRRQTLEEEMEFMKKVHEQELKELAALAYRDTTAENREFWKSELGQAIRDIQQEYDAKVEQLRGDMEGFYNLKIQEYRTGATKQNMEVTHIREENKKLTKQMSDLRGKLADLEARNAQLEKQYQDALRELESKETDHMMETTQLKEEIIKLRAEMEGILTELQTLMDAKLSLELEIAAYRKLLEGEENRVDWRSRASLIMYRDAFKPRSDRTEQESTREKEPEKPIEAKTDKTVSRQPDQREPSPDTDAASSITMSDNEMSQKGDEGDLELEEQLSGDKGLDAVGAESKAVADLDYSGVGTVNGSVESIKSPIHEHVVKVKEEIKKLETQKAALDEIDSKENGHVNDIETELEHDKILTPDELNTKTESNIDEKSSVEEVIELTTSSVVESGINEDLKVIETLEQPEMSSKNVNESDIDCSEMIKPPNQINGQSDSVDEAGEKAGSSKDVSESDIKDSKQDMKVDEIITMKTNLDETATIDKPNFLLNGTVENSKRHPENESKQSLPEKTTPIKDDFENKIANQTEKLLENDDENQIVSTTTNDIQTISESKKDMSPEKITPLTNASDLKPKEMNEKSETIEIEDKIHLKDSKLDDEQAVDESKQDIIPEEITSKKNDFDQKVTDEKVETSENESQNLSKDLDISEKSQISEGIVSEKISPMKDEIVQKVECEKQVSGGKEETDEIQVSDQKDLETGVSQIESEKSTDDVSRKESQSKQSPDKQETPPSEIYSDQTYDTDAIVKDISKLSDVNGRKSEDNSMEDSSIIKSNNNEMNKNTTPVNVTKSVEIGMKESEKQVSVEMKPTDELKQPTQKVSEIELSQFENIEKSEVSKSFTETSSLETVTKTEFDLTETDKHQKGFEKIEHLTKSDSNEISALKQTETAENVQEKADSVSDGEIDRDLKELSTQEGVSKETESTDIENDFKHEDKKEIKDIPAVNETVSDSGKTETESGSDNSEKDTKRESIDIHTIIESHSANVSTVDTPKEISTEEVKKIVNSEVYVESKEDIKKETLSNTEKNENKPGEPIEGKELVGSVQMAETGSVKHMASSELSESSSTVASLKAVSETSLTTMSQKSESKHENIKSETIKETLSSKSESSETISAESEKNKVVTAKNLVSDKTEAKLELTEKTEDKILESVVQSKVIEKSQDSARLEMSPTKELPESFPEAEKDELQHLSKVPELSKTDVPNKESQESETLPTAKSLPESLSSEQIEDDKTPDDEEPNANSNLKLSSGPSELQEKSPDRSKIEETLTASNTAGAQHVELTSKSEALSTDIISDHLHLEGDSGDTKKTDYESEKDNLNQNLLSKENDIMTQSFISDNGLLTNGDIKEADDSLPMKDTTLDEGERTSPAKEVSNTKHENAEKDSIPDKLSEPVQRHDAVLQEKIESLLLNGQENVKEATPPTNKPDSQVSMKMMRGEVSAKTTYQRTSTGPIAVSEVDPNGKYITLENTSSGPNRKDVNLDGWKLKRSVDGMKEYCYNFRNFTLKPGKKVKIVARGSASDAGLNDLVFREEDSWGVGQQVTTLLVNDKSEEKASHIQRTNYN